MFCVIPAVAGAQTQDLPLPPAVTTILEAFQKPFHPLLGGVAPGGGLGVGIGYTTPRSEDWFRDGSAMITVNRFWYLRGETGRQTNRSQIGVFGQMRNMGRLDFFGIGPDSSREARTDFRLRETTGGVRGYVRPIPAIRLGGYAAIYSPQLGSGGSPALSSIEEIFLPVEVPALNDDPTFTRYRGFVEFYYPQAADSADEGYRATYQIAGEAFRDRDLNRYNFHRFETETKQRFRGFRPGQRLTVHGLMALTNSDGLVPYYLQYTLGGGGGLSAFRPDMLGTDGSMATVRSYQNYRFRDRDIVLMQAEYRIPLGRSIDATVFYDAGQVAGRAADLFDGFKQGTGFSLSYMHKGATLGRVDVGYGAGEGLHFFWGFGGFNF